MKYEKLDFGHKKMKLGSLYERLNGSNMIESSDYAWLDPAVVFTKWLLSVYLIQFSYQKCQRLPILLFYPDDLNVSTISINRD